MTTKSPDTMLADALDILGVGIGAGEVAVPVDLFGKVIERLRTHDARVTELLNANNETEERMREAQRFERRADASLKVTADKVVKHEQTIDFLSSVIADFAKELDCEADNEAVLAAIDDLKNSRDLAEANVSALAETVADAAKALGCEPDGEKILAAIDRVRGGATWRHKKRGTTYREIGCARVQSASEIDEDDVVMVYRDQHEGLLWARPIDEFLDGRFEKIKGDGPLYETDAERQARAKSTISLTRDEVDQTAGAAYQQGFRAGIDAAAQVVDRHAERVHGIERDLIPRSEGDKHATAYAVAIRALAPTLVSPETEEGSDHG